jgi:TolB protein
VGFDERIRAELERAAERPDPAGAFERVVSRRRRRHAARHLGTALLGVVVVAGTVLGTHQLDRTFRAGAGRGGMVAFVRNLEPCYEHPNVGGGLDLFAIDVATGEQRLVSTVPLWPDGSYRSEQQPDFSPDGGRYVWVDRYRGNLYLSDVATGETKKLVDGAVSQPRFSPDGSQILYVQSVRFQVPGIPGDRTIDVPAAFVASADGFVVTRVTDPAEGPVGTATWTMDGRLALTSPKSEGVMLSEAEEGLFLYVMGSESAIEVEPDPDGTYTEHELQQLAEENGIDLEAGTEFFLANPDGSGVEKVYDAPGGVDFADGEWSPDGSKVAGEVVHDGGNHDIYVLDVETRTPTRLTFFAGDDTSPTWSPDGSLIAFATGRWGTGPGHSEIAVMTPDGNEVRRLTNDCWDDYATTWIPAATSVERLPIWTPPPLPELGRPQPADPNAILVEDEVEGVWDLYAVDPATGEQTKITADLPDQLSPRWSPDHSMIAFGGDLDERGNLDVYVMRADGSELRRLTSDPEGESRPSWSPDGERIAFEGPGGLWIVNVDGSGRAQLTTDDGDLHAAWSPDGSRIAYARDGEIWTVAPDGSDQQMLVDHHAYELDWSPDGSRLLFTCERDICVVNADGTGLVNLTRSPEDTYERGSAWSPDGSQILFASDRASRDQGMRLFVMNADGTNVHDLGAETLGQFGFCCPEADW